MSKYRFRIRETKLLNVEVEVDDGSDPADEKAFSQEAMKAAIKEFRHQQVTRTIEVIDVSKVGVNYEAGDEG
jgi:hypothetical protein